MNPIIRKLNRLAGTPRVLVSLATAVLVFGVTKVFKVHDWTTGLTLAWDTFAFTLITLSAITFFTLPQKEIHQQAQIQDEQRTVTFILVLLSIGVSFMGILLQLQDGGKDSTLHRVASLGGIALSWLLLHTIFTLRYAHLYYNEQDENIRPRGLDFPGEEELPDYPDFMYFSFVIGMTFQVSDVEITSRHIRRVVLLHSFLSFVFNTVIVALTISVLSSIGK